MKKILIFLALIFLTTPAMARFREYYDYNNWNYKSSNSRFRAKDVLHIKKLTIVKVFEDYSIVRVVPFSQFEQDGFNVKVLFFTAPKSKKNKVYEFNDRTVKIYKIKNSGDKPFYESSEKRREDYYKKIKSMELKKEKAKNKKEKTNSKKPSNVEEVSIKDSSYKINKYFGKTISLEGRIELSTFYTNNYRKMKDSHFAFKILDKNKLHFVMAYVRKDSFEGKSLRDKILKNGKFSGKFMVKIPEQPKCSYFVGDLMVLF